MFLYAFDLIEPDGKDPPARAAPDAQGHARQHLEERPRRASASMHRKSENGAAMFRYARKLGLEGIVSS